MVTNGTLTSANFSPVPGTLYGVYDQISRPDESASSNFINLDANWRASDVLSFFGQFGTSQGDGKTPTQNVSETDPGTGNGCWLHAAWHRLGTELQSEARPTIQRLFPTACRCTFNWIFGAQDIDVKDKETWYKIDGDFAMQHDTWTDLKFGVRYQTHERSSFNAIAQGPPSPAGQRGCTDHSTTRRPTVIIPATSIRSAAQSRPASGTGRLAARDLQRPWQGATRSDRTCLLPVLVRRGGKELGSFRAGRLQGHELGGKRRTAIRQDKRTRGYLYGIRESRQTLPE